jgi:hypothetical protein
MRLFLDGRQCVPSLRRAFGPLLYFNAAGDILRHSSSLRLVGTPTAVAV